MELLQLALLLVVAQFIPGPDFALVTRASLIYGSRYGTYCALGIGTAILFHCLVICLGGTYILEQNVLLTRSILAVSAIWILYLSWKTWPKKSKTAPAPTEEAENIALPRKRELYFQAVITNLLNPKCFLFIASLFISHLLPGHKPYIPYAITAIAAGQAVVLWAVWGYVIKLGPLEKILTRHKDVLDRAFSILFSVFAIMVMYEVIFWSNQTLTK